MYWDNNFTAQFKTNKIYVITVKTFHIICMNAMPIFLRYKAMKYQTLYTSIEIFLTRLSIIF